MEEKYFIIDVKNRECGPFTEDELNDIGLYEDSLIFCADWNERKPLNQIRELDHIHRKSESIKPYNLNYGKNLILNTKPNTKINENEEWENPYSLKRKKVRIVLVSWLFFQLIALILSKLNIRLFDYSDSNSLFDTNSEIWPFVDFISVHYGRIESHEIFNGIFYFYDISEFILYNLIFGFIWFLRYTNKQTN